MSHLSVGERVELRSCTGLPGTVTGFVRGRVEVLFDDCRNEPAKLFRPESLQPTGSVSARGYTHPAGTRSERGNE
jgi:hypothetical protein